MEKFRDLAEEAEAAEQSRRQSYPGEVDRLQVAIGEQRGKARAYEDAWRQLAALLEVDDGE